MNLILNWLLYWKAELYLIGSQTLHVVTNHIDNVAFNCWRTSNLGNLLLEYNRIFEIA